jgi:hypothetical protein
MADNKQLKRLKNDINEWNFWRNSNPDIKIDLSNADLIGTNLMGANLERAYIREANLNSANLSDANFTMTNLRKADVSKADLGGANLTWAKLDGTNLMGADLRWANLNGAHLVGANLRKARIGFTGLGEIDLSETIGLEEVRHHYESHMSTSTLQLSTGKIPDVFLRGCGLSDWEIESAKLYRPGLSAKEVNDILYRIYDLRENQAIQINPLFISYSHKDRPFVDEMENHLNEKGIRFWRDIHDAVAGPLEKMVDKAMRMNPTVLLILSENSVKSDWVEHEALLARGLEQELGRDVLCPVALDDAWKECSWPERLREHIMEYNILDFSKWKNRVEFVKVFKKLLAGLDLFYKAG